MFCWFVFVVQKVGAPQQLMREASRRLLLALFYLPTYIVRDDIARENKDEEIIIVSY